MTRHAVGKWGRGEGLEKKSAKRRHGMSSYDPLYSTKAWCFLCGAPHRRVDCPEVADGQVRLHTDRE